MKSKHNLVYLHVFFVVTTCEYLSHPFQLVMTSNCILQQTSYPRTPEQNRVTDPKTNI